MCHKMAKILWVQDEYEGPLNGLVEYQGEKLWFSRTDIPTMISSTKIPVPPIKISEPNERIYTLTRLNKLDLEKVIENHLTYCELTGLPINHGDSLIIRSSKQVAKNDIKIVNSLPSEDKSEVKALPRPLCDVKSYNHKVNLNNMNGEFVTIIRESEFINYLVPHTVKMIII
jgi:hypothetical protein